MFYIYLCTVNICWLIRFSWLRLDYCEMHSFLIYSFWYKFMYLFFHVFLSSFPFFNSCMQVRWHRHLFLVSCTIFAFSWWKTVIPAIPIFDFFRDIYVSICLECRPPLFISRGWGSIVWWGRGSVIVCQELTCAVYGLREF